MSNVLQPIANIAITTQGCAYEVSGLLYDIISNYWLRTWVSLALILVVYAHIMTNRIGLLC